MSKRKTPKPSAATHGDDAVFLSDLYRSTEYTVEGPEGCKEALAAMDAHLDRYLSQRLTMGALRRITERLVQFHEVSGGADFIRALKQGRPPDPIAHPELAAHARNGFAAAIALTDNPEPDEALAAAFLLGQSLANCRALQRKEATLRGLDLDPGKASTAKRRSRNLKFWKQLHCAWKDYCEEENSPVPNDDFLRWLNAYGEETYHVTIDGNLNENPNIYYAGQGVKWETIRKKINKLNLRVAR